MKKSMDLTADQRAQMRNLATSNIREMHRAMVKADPKAHIRNFPEKIIWHSATQGTLRFGARKLKTERYIAKRLQRRAAQRGRASVAAAAIAAPGANR